MRNVARSNNSFSRGFIAHARTTEPADELAIVGVVPLDALAELRELLGGNLPDASEGRHYGSVVREVTTGSKG